MFAILYLLILELYYFFKNTTFKKKGTKIVWGNLLLIFIGIGYCGFSFLFMMLSISYFLVKSPSKIISISLIC